MSSSQDGREKARSRPDLFVNGEDESLSTPETESTSRLLEATHIPAMVGGTQGLPELFGRYHVIRLIGRGAMGSVYLADDTQLSRRVAIKIPKFAEGNSTELLQRFHREAQAAAALRNPHLCPVYDVGEIDGQHYISMAYIDGRRLSDVIAANGILPERQVLLLVRKVALAMQHAHEVGIVHRDLKPGNIMIDSRNEPVVMDFGLAYQIEEGASRLTQNGAILGSPAYMSPEQLEGDSVHVTPAADQYSLGVILYEMLTGQLPFRGSFTSIAGQIATKPAPSPRALRPELDPRVDELCLRMLSKRPNDRLESMKEVADRILKILKEPAAPPKATVEQAERKRSVTPVNAGVASMNSGALQQRVATHVERGELVTAIKLLKQIGASETDADADWVRSQKAELEGQLARWRGEIPSLALLGAKLLRKHDYSEAVRILSAVPVEVRTEPLRDLLAEASEKEEEVAHLLKEIEFSIRDERPRELSRLVKRFLQLKPGHKGMQALAHDLQKYGPEKAILLRRGRTHLFDPVGPVWNRSYAAYYVGGLTLVCLFAYWYGLFPTKATRDLISVEKAEANPSEKDVASQTTNGSDSSTAAADQWIDLLADVDLKFASQNILSWTREGDRLIGTRANPDEGGWTTLVPPQAVSGDYDVAFDCRLVGSTYLQLGLPLDDTSVAVSFTESGAGLHWIDRKDMNARAIQPPLGNPTSQIREGQLHHIKASVRHRGNEVSIVTSLDGVESGRFDGLRSRLTDEVSPRTAQFKFVTKLGANPPDRRIELQNARVRLIGNASGGSSSPGQEEGWIALLGKDDFGQLKPTNKAWEMEDGTAKIDPDRMTGVSYLWSDETYDDFELRMQYRILNRGYLGLGLHYSLDGTGSNVGPLVQLSYFRGKSVIGGLFTLLERKPTDLVMVSDEQTAQIEPKVSGGEWIDLYVRSEGKRLIAEFNGIRTIDFTDESSRLPTTGKIALYAPGYDRVAAEVRDVRVRPLNVSGEAVPEAAPVVAEASPQVEGDVLLDVDFRKTAGGFSLADEHHILSEHKDGEYRYLGKKTGWWHNGLHPTFWKKENNQLRDFAVEVDIRLVGKKKGLFAIDFGRSGNDTLSLCLDESGRVKLLRGNEDLVPPILSPAMRPVDEFNTLLMRVEDKEVRVSVNGRELFAKQLDRYGGGIVSLWLGPDEVPFDVRLQRFRLVRLDGGPPKYDQELRRFKGHSETIRAVAFLPDGLQALSAGNGRAFKLWDVTTGQLVHDFEGHTDHVTSVSLSGDGKRAVTGCDDGLVRVWDLENRELIRTLKGHTAAVVSVVLSKDGETAVSGATNGEIRRWNLRMVSKSDLLPGPPVEAILAVSPAEDVVVSGHTDGTLVLRGPLGVAPLLGHGPGYFGGLAFTPDGTKLLTGSDEGWLRMWDLTQGKEVHRFESDGVGIDSVVMTSNGRYVIAGIIDHTIRAWDIETGDQVMLLRADLPVTHRLAISPDNRYVLTGGGDWNWSPAGDYDLRLWELPSPPAP